MLPHSTTGFPVFFDRLTLIITRLRNPLLVVRIDRPGRVHDVVRRQLMHQV